MVNLDLLKEAGALGNYGITASDAQSLANKARAQRRVNIVKATLVGMYGGHWDRNYRDGWIGLPVPYNTGTAVFTNGSYTVTGSGTTWTSSYNGQLIQAGTAFYRIANVVSATSLILTQPFQGTTSAAAGITYLIWQDLNRLYPDALVIDDFLNYIDPSQMSEAWKGNLRNKYTAPGQNQTPELWSNYGTVPLTSTVSSGTVSGSANSNTLTGAGTTWLTGTTPLEPGWEITIGSTIYRVRTVVSDTQVTLYQMLTAAVAALTTYTAVGKNSIQVRFMAPTVQQIASYGYYTKDWPFINDNDTDWIAETYPHVLISGMTYMDYLDKNDTVRAREARLAWMDLVKDMHVAEHMNYTGVRTVGYNIPASARDM